MKALDADAGFDALRAIIDTPESPLVILVDPSQQAHVPEAAGRNPIVCTSARHLSQLLGLAFEEWAEYRDAVVGKGATP